MKYLLLPIKGLYFLYATISFVVLMLLVFPVVIIASFFGKISGGNFIYRCCAFWADTWFLLIGIRHRNLGEVPQDNKQQYIFVANHISYLDIPVIVKTIRQPVRILAKAEMGKVPVFGFIYRNAAVTVNRSSAEGRAKSVRVLKSVIRQGVSIFIFPEGTFNESDDPLRGFYDGAFRIAIETQTPIKPVLFLDTYARQHYRSIFSLNPGRSRSVFLEPVTVEGLTVKDVPALKEKVYNLMAGALRKYKAEWIQ
jgi:1-acyl-sn-glycerol-3-phosphate acyltransferase